MGKIFTVASGSSGNCTYIGYGKNGILIDAGVSAKAITQALSEQDIDINGIMGIFITHEHTDHISGLKVFANKHNLPVFASSDTLNRLVEMGIAGDNGIVVKTVTTAGDFSVTRFATSHDCEGSSGYIVELPDGQKCAVCTDLGIVTDDIREQLSGCNAVLLESNHDVTLLQKGTYPEVLKRRILSDCGHLSNNACAIELPKLVDSGTTRIILGHLSRENNRPQIARSAAVAALMDKKMVENSDYKLFVAPPKMGEVVKF